MNFEGDPNLGLYGFATDKYCVAGLPSTRGKLEKELGVNCFLMTAFNTGLAGIFAAGNSTGIVVSSLVDSDERKAMSDMNVLYLGTHYTALGNLILLNDSGVLVSPLLRKEKASIDKFFGTRSAVTKIAGSVIIGKTGIATNKGCLLHPKVRKKEMQLIEDILGVEADIGTMNFGSPYPGAGIIANSNGFAASEQCSGHELGRITEALGFL